MNSDGAVSFILPAVRRLNSAMKTLTGLRTKIMTWSKRHFTTVCTLVVAIASSDSSSHSKVRFYLTSFLNLLANRIEEGKIEKLSFWIGHFQKQLESCQLDTYPVAPRPSRFWLVCRMILYSPSKNPYSVGSNAVTKEDQIQGSQRHRYVGEPQ